MRSMVEGVCGGGASVTADAPSTALRAVPLPRCAGQDEVCVAKPIFHFVIAGLDPAIHAERGLAQRCRALPCGGTSAWTAGS
jgi:hypothetical protein